LVPRSITAKRLSMPLK